MALISKSSEYGLRAALYIAGRPAGEHVSVREMSETMDISFHFLTKILQKLARAGLLKSTRGAKGGIALAKLADQITLLDIVRSIEGASLFESCILGLAGCGEKRPCPLHRQWGKERARIEKIFRRTTLARLARETARDGLRLAD
jgi:Rrf2 family protein